MRRIEYAGHYEIDKLPDYIISSKFICIKDKEYKGIFAVDGICPHCINQNKLLEDCAVFEIYEANRELENGLEGCFSEQVQCLVDEYELSNKFSIDIGIETLMFIEKNLTNKNFFDKNDEGKILCVCSNELIKNILQIVEHVYNKWYKGALSDNICEISNEFALKIVEHYLVEYNWFYHSKKYIEKISVERLFGYHSFELNLNQQAISIIIGTNGLGKTTIFKVLETILASNEDSELEKYNKFKWLACLPYKSIVIEFQDKTKISVIKQKEKDLKFKIKYNARGGAKFDYLPDVEVSMNERLFNLVEKIVKNQRDKLISDNDIWLIQKDCAKADEKSNIKNRCIGLSSRGKHSNEQDNNISLVLDLFQQINRNSYNISRIFPRITKQNRFVFVKTRRIPIERIKKDILVKYNCFCDLNGEVKSFNENLDKVNEFFKKLYYEKDPSKKTLDVSNGVLRLVCEKTNETIDIEDLSTGELNILSILYEIIVRAEKDSVILIDEPEISLHIAWQQRLGEIIQEIVENKKGVQVILATHSPFIAAGNTDLLVEAKLIGG